MKNSWGMTLLPFSERVVAILDELSDYKKFEAVIDFDVTGNVLVVP